MQLFVNVKPNQRLNAIERKDEVWVVRLRAPAVDGKANEALVEYLSTVLRIAKSKIVLVKGHTARVKCLQIEAEEEKVIPQLEKALK